MPEITPEIVRNLREGCWAARTEYAIECSDKLKAMAPELAQAYLEARAKVERLTKQDSSLYYIPKGCICMGDGLLGMKCESQEHARLKVSIIALIEKAKTEFITENVALRKALPGIQASLRIAARNAKHNRLGEGSLCRTTCPACAIEASVKVAAELLKEKP